MYLNACNIFSNSCSPISKNHIRVMPTIDNATAAVGPTPFSVFGVHASGGSPFQSDTSSESTMNEVVNETTPDPDLLFLLDCVLNPSSQCLFDPFRAFWSSFDDKILIQAIPVLEPETDVCTSGLVQLLTHLDPQYKIHSISKVSEMAIELLVNISQYSEICKIMYNAGWTIIPAGTPYNVCGVDVDSKAQMIVEVKRRFLEILMTSNNSAVVGYYQQAYDFLCWMQQF